MSAAEGKVLRDAGYDHQALKDLKIKYREFGSIDPFVVTCSGTGKLLHYNGAVKPWTLDELEEQPVKPLCQVPRALRHRKWEHSTTVKVLCDEKPFVTCVDL